MTGTVDAVTPGKFISIKMDEHLDNAEEWDNCVMFYSDWHEDAFRDMPVCVCRP